MILLKTIPKLAISTGLLRNCQRAYVQNWRILYSGENVHHVVMIASFENNWFLSSEDIWVLLQAGCFMYQASHFIRQYVFILLKY